jgi:hypothetical protein
MSHILLLPDVGWSRFWKKYTVDSSGRQVTREPPVSERSFSKMLGKSQIEGKLCVELRKTRGSKPECMLSTSGLTFLDCFPYFEKMIAILWDHLLFICVSVCMCPSVCVFPTNFLGLWDHLTVFVSVWAPRFFRRMGLMSMTWLGHIARMWEKRNAYRILVGKSEGKRPVGRPRRTRMGSIKLNLR